MYNQIGILGSNIERLGFFNRGVKAGNGLYVIRKTRAKAMLIEVCFCDNEEDVAVYNDSGAQEAIAQAVFNGIYKYAVRPDAVKLEDPTIPFISYVGEIAKRDWERRKIILPSVVVAQAMKESARGTSELAREYFGVVGVSRHHRCCRPVVGKTRSQLESAVAAGRVAHHVYFVGVDIFIYAG